MTRDELTKAWPILEAFKAGKVVQYRCVDDAPWRDVTDNVDAEHLARYPDDYRIKPEPREVWCNVYPNLKDGSGVVFGPAYASKEQADYGASCGRIECIHFRQVLDNDDAKPVASPKRAPREWWVVPEADGAQVDNGFLFAHRGKLESFLKHDARRLTGVSTPEVVRVREILDEDNNP